MPTDFDALAERITPDQLAAALGAERHRDGWRCPMPDHPDNDPSWSPYRSDDGRTIATCHSRCGTHSAVQWGARVWGCTIEGAAERLADAAGLSGTGAQPRRQVASYDYRSGSGELLFQVVRFDPKDFRQRRPDGRGGWTWSVRGVERVPYRLPELLAAVRAGRTVYVVEGEKDADALAAAGLDATCNAGGAGKWRPAYADALAGARVVVLPDADGPGRDHARQVAASLFGTAADVRVVELPGLPEGGDVSDWLAAGGAAEELDRLAEAAPAWAPELAEPDPDAPQIRTMREVLATAGAESLPVALVPRLAYSGRAVLFAGREKSGKSTLLSAGIAAASQGRVFLAEPCRPASALWLTAEEREDDVARRLEGFGADPDRVWIVAAPKLSHVLNDLRAGVERLRPDVVVVDTLASLVRLLPRDERPAPGDSTAWTPVVLTLVELAHQLGAAVVIVGHASKATGEYRDSTAIGASVDAILEMKDGRTGNERRVSVRGRWSGLEDFAVRFGGGEFALKEGTLPLKSRVLLYVSEDPGCSARALREGVEGQGRKIDAARNELLAEGLLKDHGDGTVMQLWPCPTASISTVSEEAGTRFGTRGVCPAENPQGHATDTGSGHSADAGCVPSRQPIEGAGRTRSGEWTPNTPDTPPESPTGRAGAGPTFGQMAEALADAGIVPVERHNHDTTDAGAIVPQRNTDTHRITNAARGRADEC
jgi:hypothetical protein